MKGPTAFIKHVQPLLVTKDGEAIFKESAAIGSSKRNLLHSAERMIPRMLRQFYYGKNG